MILLGLILLVVASAAEKRPVLSKRGSEWSAQEAGRRYLIQKPSPVKYDADELDRFLFTLMDKLENMPLPDDPNYEIVRDHKKQLQACQIPEDDDDSMEMSPNPDDVMDTVMRSFADGKCASRRFGEWYYQVCGNMAVKRSPFTITSKKGKPKVTPFRAYESLGVLGRDRKVSRHLSSVSDPRYVQQTYYGGAKCNLGGDARTMESTVTFECNRRFVAGYVHIAEVVEEHPCKYRLQLQSSDFCDNDWLLEMAEPNSVIKCRLYFHPERIKPLMTFLDKFVVEQTAKKRRYAEFMELPENKALFQQQLHRSDVRKRMEEFADGHLSRFEKHDAEFGPVAERERGLRIIDYVMSELTWASINPDAPYSEEEQRGREKDVLEGRAEDKRNLATTKGKLEKLRKALLEHEAMKEDEREFYEIMSYTELLNINPDSVLFNDVYISYYASWLDYMKYMEAEEWMVVRSLIFAPSRKFPLGTYLLLEALITSEYAQTMRELFDGLEKAEEAVVPQTLYDGGELDEDEVEEITRRFMKAFKQLKQGDDASVLFDLLDDEDFEY